MSTAMSLQAGLASDLAAILLLAYAVYFRRYHRRDLLLAYVALNVGVLAVTVLLAGAQAGIGLGLGLFGILSIIRLRSDQLTQEEVAYYFVALALGLVNGLRPTPGWLGPATSAVLVAIMYAVDHPRLGGRTHRQLVTLDVAYRPFRAAPGAAAATRRRGPPRGRPRDRHGARCHRGRCPLPNSPPSPRAGCGFCPPTRASIVTARSRASGVVAASVAGLPAASLAEVVERSALQARIEHKYLVPLERFAELAARLPDTNAVLEIDRRRGFAYESVYFDTPDLLTYRQHLQGRRRRYKVRTRAYLDSGDCSFEVKLKGRREQTIKARLPHPIADRTRLTPQAHAFLAGQLQKAYGEPAPQLAAKVTIAYRRTTLVDLQRGTRLTCDVDLTCTGGGRTAVGLSRHVLVETKRPGPHGDADIALRSLGLRPIEISKYCVAVALLHPGIRHNPWHRALQRYFTDATPSAPSRDPTPISLRTS